MNLLQILKNNNIIQTGNFILSSGIKSSIYIDLKKVISFPDIHKYICEEISKKIIDKNNLICGAPYGAISYSSIISIMNKQPMIFLRKETKKYGTKKLIEGNYNIGDKIILIEDVVTTGNSVINAAKILEEHGLIVTQIISVISRSKEDIYYNNIKIEYLINFHCP